MATEIKKPARGGGALYETDVVAWAEAQAAALRAGRFEELDLENLAEEIADVAKREADAVESHLEVLLLHLLTWRHQPGHRSGSRAALIRLERRRIAKLLRDSPSLRPRLQTLLDRAYPDARIRASAEIGSPHSRAAATSGYISP